MSWILLLSLFYGFRSQAQLPQVTEKGKWPEPRLEPREADFKQTLNPWAAGADSQKAAWRIPFLDAYLLLKKKKKSIDKRDKEEKQEKVNEWHS